MQQQSNAGTCCANSASRPTFHRLRANCGFGELAICGPTLDAAWPIGVAKTHNRAVRPPRPAGGGRVLAATCGGMAIPHPSGMPPFACIRGRRQIFGRAVEAEHPDRGLYLPEPHVRYASAGLVAQWLCGWARGYSGSVPSLDVDGTYSWGALRGSQRG